MTTMSNYSTNDGGPEQAFHQQRLLHCRVY